MLRKRLYGSQTAIAAISIAVSISVCPLVAAGNQSPDYKRLFVDRLSRVQAVTAKFRQETVFFPTADDLRRFAEAAKNGQRGYLYQGLYIQDGQFSFLDGRALYDVTYAPETIKRFETENAVFVRRTTKSYALDRAESLVEHSGTGQTPGRISNSERLPEEYPIDVALGLRCYHDQVWLNRSRLDTAVCTVTNEGRVVIRISDQEHPDITHKWEIDPVAHGAIVGYQCIAPDAMVYCDIKCSDFKAYGELSLPRVVEVRYTAHWRESLHVTCTVKVIVNEYSVKSPDNTPERYHISYPSRSLINDARIDVPLRAPTTRSFSDREIFELAKARDANIAPRPDPSNAVSRLVWIVASAGLIVLLLLCAHRYRRSNSQTVGKR